MLVHSKPIKVWGDRNLGSTPELGNDGIRMVSEEPGALFERVVLLDELPNRGHDFER